MPGMDRIANSAMLLCCPEFSAQEIRRFGAIVFRLAIVIISSVFVVVSPNCLLGGKLVLRY
jgi:hypothetical protein